MDLAITIFWIGVGVGALLVGIGVIMTALTLRPLARDARALANDARRLTRLAESELNTLLGRARELTEGAEVLSADLAVQLDALKAQTEELEQKVLGEPAAEVAASVPPPPDYAPPDYAPPDYAAPPEPAAEPMPVGDPMAVGDPMGRDAIGSVQSPHAREDEQIA